MKPIYSFLLFVLGVGLITILAAVLLGMITVLAYRLVVLFLSLIITSNLGGKLLVGYLRRKR